MTTIKEYKEKLNSFTNIEKITRTMKLVSASKLRQAHKMQTDAKRYAHELTALISRIEASIDPGLHPLLKSREKIKNILILIFTSDKGLCGSFNNSLCKQVASWIEDKRTQYEKIDLAFCGKRGFMFFKNYSDVRKHYEGATVKPNFAQATQIQDDLSKWFLEEECDEVYLAYNQFFNPLVQKFKIEKILPIDSKYLAEGDVQVSSDYIFEPTIDELLEILIPRFLCFKIFYTLLENSAGEYGARMTAMDKATQNANELIDEYTLLRNRARQAAITTELIEIVSGAEALK